ncbi:hypothetical protein AARAC_001325 [Aspergillus arachidicola]|uniref:Protein alcS n=1 Tax=Aspergillus arachidicola TaxID=656916 RepID=A0A2G7FW34_9EURO|nr:hypothetical protein AARAC_001325 [Aspergillus arachidicola]
MVSDKNMNSVLSCADSGSYQQENGDGTLPRLSQIPTSVTLSAEQFEMLYLSPMMRRQSSITKSMGNPTPLRDYFSIYSGNTCFSFGQKGSGKYLHIFRALGAFVLTAAPLAYCLMGWRGAGGAGAAGVLILFGGLLLIVSSILEFVIGNTFPCVVFAHFGGFCLAFGATMTPSFNSTAPYSETTVDTVAGLHSSRFLNTFAFFFVFMALLMFIYMVCALRTNAIFVAIFMFLVSCFSLLSAAYWRMAQADLVLGTRLSVVAGTLLFVVTMLGFYLLTTQLFASVGLPWSLPIGDLSRFWEHKKNVDDTEGFGA